MSTILEELRSKNMAETSLKLDAEPTDGSRKDAEPLIHVYRCRACGYIFDESLEGKPFSTLTECPLCHVSPGGFMQLR